MFYLTKLNKDDNSHSYFSTKKELCCGYSLEAPGQGASNYSRLSLSPIPRDSINYFEIFVPGHIRFAKLRKNVFEQPHLTNIYVIGLLKLEIY